MSRPASGDEAVLKKARAAIAAAHTVEQLRQAQAVVLPLDYGLSLLDTALVIGVSRGWACQLRRRFIDGKAAGAPDAPARGGRQHQNMTLEEERQLLAPYVALASAGGVLGVSQIKAALDRHLGREVALASVYNLLHRHGWKKRSPDTPYPRTHLQAQQEWNNNSSQSVPASTKRRRQEKPEK